MRVWLLRHGEPAPEKHFRFEHNPSLGFRGKRQARLAGKVLANNLLSSLYSSTLARALETATICSSLIGKPVICREEFCEFDVGLWSGLRLDEVQKKFPGEYEAWTANKIAYRRGGGESYLDLEKRVISVLSYLETHHKRNENIVVVTHAGVIRSLLSALGIFERDYANEVPIAHCSITQIETESKKLISLNDVSHLSSEAEFMQRLQKSGILKNSS